MSCHVRPGRVIAEGVDLAVWVLFIQGWRCSIMAAGDGWAE